MARIGTLFLLLGGAGMAQDNPVPSGLANPPPPPPTNAPVAPPPPRTLSPVIWTENPEVVQRFNVDGAMVRQMVDSALMKLTSAPDLGTAWTRLGITPRDVVGIKVATMGGPLLSSHHAIVQAICDGLQAAGVPPSQIIIWDKDARDMQEAGYTPIPASGSHINIVSIFPGAGYDPDAVYKSDLLGTLIWGDSEFIRHDDDLMTAASQAVKNKGYGDNGVTSSASGDDGLSSVSSAPQTSNRSHFTRIVTTLCTKIINVPVLTDNSYIGINGCLGSLALACVDNNRRFLGDPTYGDPSIDEILSNNLIRRKVVVHILDALIAQYAGGPRFDPVFTKSIGAIYVSRDPVAIDSLVLGRMEAWRAADKQGRIDPIGKAASHIHTATDYNLGTDDPARIQLVETAMNEPNSSQLAIERLLEIMARLRAPDGCAWDRVQTPATLKPQMLEECYEVLEAIDSGSAAHLTEELGDLLLHVVFQAQIAHEQGDFTFADVANGVADKLIRRHPHVFGEIKENDPAAIVAQWNELKKGEKPERESALDGVPLALPALMRAEALQEKARAVGFDWPDVRGSLDKVREEVAEVTAEIEADLAFAHANKTKFVPTPETAEEIGDLLFSIVNLTRHLKLDAEGLLTGANDKFSRRFRAVEERIKAQGKAMTNCTLDELDAAWNEVKRQSPPA